jgi:hypothetical protein
MCHQSEVVDVWKKNHTWWLVPSHRVSHTINIHYRSPGSSKVIMKIFFEKVCYTIYLWLCHRYLKIQVLFGIYRFLEHRTCLNAHLANIKDFLLKALERVIKQWLFNAHTPNILSTMCAELIISTVVINAKSLVSFLLRKCIETECFRVIKNYGLMHSDMSKNKLIIEGHTVLVKMIENIRVKWTLLPLN